MSFKIEAEVDIECIECGDSLDEGEHACTACFNKIESEKEGLEDKITDLEKDNENLQEEIDQKDERIIELEEQLKKAKGIDDILRVLDAHDMSDPASKADEQGGRT